MFINTGTELFFHLADQNIFLRNFENDRTRNFIKGSLRIVVASIALGFFARMGFCFNIVIGLGKGLIGVLTVKQNKMIFGKESKVILQEAKTHLIRAIIDFAVATFKHILVFAYAISPTRTKNMIEKRILFE